MSSQPSPRKKLDTPVLFLHPSPGLKRHFSYERTCELLQEIGYDMIFVYNGPIEPALKGEVKTYHFETWEAENRGKIEGMDIHELQARYPKSNLWLAIVAERRFSNFSLLNGTHPTPPYTHEEMLYYLKAVVLFYQELIDRHQIRMMFSQHPDNVHSTILFEMGRSIDIENFMSFPDYYWVRTNYYLLNDKYFTSSPMMKTYNDLMANYNEKVVPKEGEIKALLDDRVSKDPSKQKVVQKLYPTPNLKYYFVGSAKSLKEPYKKVFWRKPSIVDGYDQTHIPTSIKAWIKRSYWAFRLSRKRWFTTEIPKQPFVFFPLQKVPEATLLVRATGTLNQQSLVQTVAASLPPGYLLVVKDHPRVNGVHPPSYYEKMLELPNVRVMVPGFDNEKLFQKASLLVTVGGTMGFQQLMRNKPVVMFGRKFYECIDGVIRINDLNQMPYVMNDILIHGKHPDPETIRRSVYAYILANKMHTHETDAYNNEIHHNPEAFSDLIDRMIQELLAEK